MLAVDRTHRSQERRSVVDEQRNHPAPAPAHRRDTGPALRFETARHPSGATVLRAIGAIDDETSPDLWVELGIRSEQADDIVLDLSGVDVLGTAGLTALLESRDRFDAEGRRLRILCGTGRAARRALQVTGAMEQFEVLDRLPDGPAGSRDTVFGVPDPGTRLDGSPRTGGG